MLPYGKEVIRPEIFAMAVLMASGHQISLAPMVLGYMYHGLEEAASHPDHPGKANTIFPSHYIIGWLAELFPCLYCHRPGSDSPSNFPSLVYYAGARSYREDSSTGRDVIDMGLPDEDFKFVLSIQSSVLPIRVGAELVLEPYYPNRFACQFGFDQRVPSNRLSFIKTLRQ
ncbi:hypothetical protein Cgig2_026628 [Carnegiea gigantea]|uniref:Aminotransferase-like plant mobile domain-containing protein n=1 Tax=Carnegiea gigantea TaxID=171969 RepID=A0A9Q1JXA6_9CARY|nr:hypothetical protein Cgig2_026628 [Carnegiea gigantea]